MDTVVIRMLKLAAFSLLLLFSVNSQASTIFGKVGYSHYPFHITVGYKDHGHYKPHYYGYGKHHYYKPRHYRHHYRHYYKKPKYYGRRYYGRGIHHYRHPAYRSQYYTHKYRPKHYNQRYYYKKHKYNKHYNQH